ncbi:hypothetical protein EV194_101470 [Natronoflexus pectinivorans]|uniref:Lipocalin-like protein n=2 Tax=Natronoflexus pectinivorans TaxID=682526 RepID=A0A4R2GP85_9BACT|nr:hypothetical protein EV194_101470 [Natronoflexus pectinivorans]
MGTLTNKFIIEMRNILQITSFAIICTFLVASVQSCSSSKKSDDTVYIEGIWRISEEEIYTDVSSDTSSGLKDTDSGNDETDNEGEDNGSVERPYKTEKYHSSDQVQRYLIFENLKYSKIKIEDSEKETVEEGSYSVSGNIVTISINGKQTTAEYLINTTTLTLMYDDHPTLKKRVAQWDAIPGDGENDGNDDKDEENEDKDDNGDDEDIPTCAARHQRDARVGSKLNPKLIESDVIVEGALPDDTENGFLYRYYLQVKPYAKYNISISEISADYDEDIHEKYHYMDVIIKEEFVTDYILKESRFHYNQTSGQMTVTPATECLYIEFFSFQESIQFKLEITEQE